MNLQQKFRQVIPLFNDLPLDVYQTLDLSHFVLPNQDVEKLRSELENTLGSYVVPYHANVFRLDIPLETHLCALVKGARLIKTQLDALARYEKILTPQGITFVVFQKPFILMPVEQSAVYKKYKELNLL